jgi:pSer/pThr/pTyr-binding forkhead associated (FHA) protein
MKFCRSCGSALPSTHVGSPAFGTPVARPGSSPLIHGHAGGPMPGMPSGPLGGFPSAPAGGIPAFASPAAERTEPTALVGAAPSAAAQAAQAAYLPTGIAMAPVRVGEGSTVACPRCGTQTPLGFSYCQQCGYQMQGVPPAPPGPNARPRGPSAAPPIAARYLDTPIDPHAGTLAQDEAAAGSAIAAARGAAAAHAGPGWGSAVLVNRDGSDGQRYALTGEYLVIGRAGSDIAFDDDRFLARQHARLERGADGAVVVHPLDALNGVFRKTDAPVELTDGTIILLGREVLRYERVDPEEVKLHALVRHGVALFGSPPREPWGRLIQLVPSGGYRDVRHLSGAEIVLGREEGDIVFRDDAFMSRRHAAVTWDGRRAQITDLGSSNGSFVRLTGPAVLKHGDHLRMGDQLLRIELGR